MLIHNPRGYTPEYTQCPIGREFYPANAEFVIDLHDPIIGLRLLHELES